MPNYPGFRDDDHESGSTDSSFTFLNNKADNKARENNLPYHTSSATEPTLTSLHSDMDTCDTPASANAAILRSDPDVSTSSASTTAASLRPTTSSLAYPSVASTSAAIPDWVSTSSVAATPLHREIPRNQSTPLQITTDPCLNNSTNTIQAVDNS